MLKRFSLLCGTWASSLTLCVVFVGVCAQGERRCAADDFSADFDSSGNVDILGDGSAFVSNLGVTGTTFAQGDANGDGRVSLIFDGTTLIEQLGGPGGVPAGVATVDLGTTVSAAIDASGDISYTVSGTGTIAALYVINKSGGTISAGVDAPTDVELNNDPFALKGFPAGSTSGTALVFPTPGSSIGNFTAGTFDLFSVDSDTVLTDLHLFSQRLGEGFVPVTITGPTGLSHTSTVPVHAVPEPSSGILLAVMSLYGFRRNRRCVSL